MGPVPDVAIRPQRGEAVIQELGSCARKLGVWPLVTTLWAFRVIIIETGGLAGPHGKGEIACTCEKVNVGAFRQQARMTKNLIHSKMLIAPLSRAMHWEVLG